MLKLSSDGSSWQEVLRADPLTASLGFTPAGTLRGRLEDTTFQLDVPLTGTAVQSAATDATPGRVLLNGAHGLGAADLANVRMDDGEADLPSGFYAGSGGGSDPATFPDSSARYKPFLNLTRRITGGDYVQSRMFFSSDAIQIIERSDLASAWQVIHSLLSRQNMLGTVSKAGGVPTGAVFEYGSNASGDYLRLADGTQWCWCKINLGSRTAAGAGSYAGPCRSVESSWVFPVSYVAAPQVTATSEVDTVTQAARASSLSLRGVGTMDVDAIQAVMLSSDATAADVMAHLLAHGRWR